MNEDKAKKQKFKYLIWQDHYPSGGIWQVTTKRVYNNYKGNRKIETVQ